MLWYESVQAANAICFQSAPDVYKRQHIGIIRALEENGIPIDYIAGTSMGAIVGSLYAMGYSPDEMEALLK